MENIYDKIMQEEYQRGLRMSGQSGITPLVCPEVRGEKCRLCEMCHEVFKTEKRKDSPLREKALQYNQKKKYYSNIIFPIINPGEIKLFEYGEKILRKLLNAHMDALSEYKNFFHHVQGRNLYIIKYAAPQKRNTDYGVEFRIQSTPIQLDVTPLNRMFKLDVEDILKYLSQGVVPFRQGDLADGRNEVRILPSWLGENSSMFFNVMKYHFIPKDEFDAIQAGKLNPFKDEIIISAPSQSTNPSVGSGNAWDSYVAPPKQQAQQMVKPLCFGTYDEASPLCKDKCDKAVTKECTVETTRRTASRLYPK